MASSDEAAARNAWMHQKHGRMPSYCLWDEDSVGDRAASDAWWAGVADLPGGRCYTRFTCPLHGECAWSRGACTRVPAGVYICASKCRTTREYVVKSAAGVVVLGPEPPFSSMP
jgi:hypothetical protein